MPKMEKTDSKESPIRFGVQTKKKGLAILIIILYNVKHSDNVNQNVNIRKRIIDITGNRRMT